MFDEVFWTDEEIKKLNEYVLWLFNIIMFRFNIVVYYLIFLFRYIEDKKKIIIIYKDKNKIVLL